MSEPPTAPPRPALPGEDEADVLRSAAAGGKVIRGSAVRGLGYAVGFLLGAAIAVLLLRYLGVVQFGRYITVMSLLAIVSGVTDAGLTTVGARELAIRPRGEERDRMLANLVWLRLVITPLGVLAAIGFAVFAGYDSTLVWGTVLGGLGVILINTQAMAMLPLSVDLRLGTLTGVEVLKNVLTLAGVAALVAVGASLLPFFAIQVGVGVVVVAITPLLLRSLASIRPRFERSTAHLLVRESLPVAVALAMNIIYFRLLILLMSLIATGTETGLFGTSFRIFEVLFGVPTLVLGVALPVLAVAGQEDEPRLRYALQRMLEVGLAAAVLIALVVVIAAEPAIRLLAGPEYADAAPVLRLHAIALIAVFLGQTWQLGLVSIRRQGDMALANAAALAIVLVLGLVLIPDDGAIGAGVAAVCGEFSLALILLALLARARPALVPTFRFLPKIALAVLAAAPVALLGLPALAAAALAAAVYTALIFATGALPSDVLNAFRGLRRAS